MHLLRPIILLLCCFPCCAMAQLIRGKVVDSKTGESLFSASIVEKGTANGVNSDFDGEFKLNVSKLPVTVIIQYLGYTLQEINFSEEGQRQIIKLVVIDTDLGIVEVVGDRITEKQKQRPLTVESMDLLAIKECPTGNFYEGLGNLKGVDLTTASLGFRIINTRGFNSTSPVRSLQLIDGVDNQSPGLNFSLGNFLGACDPDVKRCDIIAGASSAFYGPGAFNGVISMETKSPFLFPGFLYSIKVGERRLFEQSFRFAEALKNKRGFDAFAYKLNFFLMRAHDWEAENYSPVYGSDSNEDNPGRFDAVNIYSDEYFAANDTRTAAPWGNSRGLELFHRTGYRESDLVDYNAKNLKASTALHFRLAPEKGFESPELILATNIGNGTTVYQGDNRFALRDIFFMQNRVELVQKENWFIRAYMTKEDAGRSYDPYATALKIQDAARSDEEWATVYLRYWNDSIKSMVDANGYPLLVPDPDWQPGDPITEYYLPYNYDTQQLWLDVYNDSLTYWHHLTEQWTNSGNAGLAAIDPVGFYEPGSAQFLSLFQQYTSAKNNEGDGGTLFFDKSALYHVHAEKIFTPELADEVRIGANMRWYRPYSDGTIFSDSVYYQHEGEDSTLKRNVIRNSEFGAYVGMEKKFMEDQLILNATLRMDKNENFRAIFTPAVSAVYSPMKNHYLRFLYSSALRNPTLSDQYLYLNVGPAILSGNLLGADSLITLDSFYDFRSTLNPDTVDYFNIDPIKPEKVQTLECGYRLTLGKDLFADLNYYYSIYRHFIGYNIGIDATFDETTGLPQNIQVFRYSANSRNEVRTQGFGIGLNYYLNNHLMVNGNYNWNKLVKSVEDDPIIPAFNTPEHKFNLGITGRDFLTSTQNENTLGFSVYYKWVQGFVFEGSPQFTGPVPSYSLMDAQVNVSVKAIDCNFKIGCSNLLNNRSIQTYGGPEIGRLAYLSVVYELINL